MELERIQYKPAHLATLGARINALAGSFTAPLVCSAGEVNALLLSYAMARDVAMLRPNNQASGTPTMLPGQRVGNADIPVIGWTEANTIVPTTQNDAADVRQARQRAWHAITEQMMRVATSPVAPTAPTRPTGAAVAIETYAASEAPILVTDDVARLLVPYTGADATQARGLALDPATARNALAPLNDAQALDRAWTSHAQSAQRRAWWAGGIVIGTAGIFGRLVRV